MKNLKEQWTRTPPGKGGGICLEPLLCPSPAQIVTNCAKMALASGFITTFSSHKNILLQGAVGGHNCARELVALGAGSGWIEFPGVGGMGSSMVPHYYTSFIAFVAQKRPLI